LVFRSSRPDDIELAVNGWVIMPASISMEPAPRIRCLPQRPPHGREIPPICFGVAVVENWW
jgi:hypothetical protein